LAIALAGHDGAQDLLARLADDVGNDVGQLHVHLRERLLHVLYVSRLTLEQHAPLAPQGTQHAHLFPGTERSAEQPVGHELLQPLAVGQGVEVDCDARELAHRLIVSIRRCGHEVRRAADVDAGG
jgi:hypothetical protein